MAVIQEDIHSIITPPEGFDSRININMQLSLIGIHKKPAKNLHLMMPYLYVQSKMAVDSRQPLEHKYSHRVEDITSKYLSIKDNCSKLECADRTL